MSTSSVPTGVMNYVQSMKVYDQRPAPIPGSSPSEENSPWTEFESKMELFGVNVKEEPMDDTRNDSGVTSGSDCPSASPVSDRSDSHPSTSPPQNNVYPFPQGRNSMHQFNPWYPTSAQAPSTSPSTSDNAQSQHIPQNNDRSSVSPKNELGGDENSNEFDDDGIRIPKINSHGKVKVHKCKQCEFFAYTKLEFWEHSHVHIKGDKILKCPKCPFVTEYKHHLEYHLLNHAGAKPFKCPHCDYSCVNKSMLNSHLKSHSKVYQYRCANCHYETKYCHSLKLHLRKYRHKPAMVLNPDGSPNPLPIIDVYGTRRGPKVKRTSESSSNSYPAASSSPQVESTPPPQMPQMPFNPLMNPLLNQAGMLPFPLPLLPGFPGALPNQEMMLSFQNLFRERLEELAKQNASSSLPEPQQQQQQHEIGALDLSNKSSHSSENGESDEEDNMTTAFDNVEVVENKTGNEAESTLTPEAAKEAETENDHPKNNNNKYDFACQYCGICFGDEIMFRIHMGYHGYSNPFTCNMCGEECENKVNFFLHIARAAH